MCNYLCSPIIFVSIYILIDHHIWLKNSLPYEEFPPPFPFPFPSSRRHLFSFVQGPHLYLKRHSREWKANVRVLLTQPQLQMKHRSSHAHAGATTTPFCPPLDLRWARTHDDPPRRLLSSPFFPQPPSPLWPLHQGLPLPPLSMHICKSTKPHINFKD